MKRIGFAVALTGLLGMAGGCFGSSHSERIEKKEKEVQSSHPPPIHNSNSNAGPIINLQKEGAPSNEQPDKREGRQNEQAEERLPTKPEQNGPQENAQSGTDPEPKGEAGGQPPEAESNPRQADAADGVNAPRWEEDPSQQECEEFVKEKKETLILQVGDTRDLGTEQPWVDAIRTVSQSPSLRFVTMEGCVTDAMVQALYPPNLEELTLDPPSSHYKLTDAALHHAHRWTSLKRLSLLDMPCSVTDAALSSIPFEQLEVLKLAGDHLKGSSLTPQNTRKLKVLWLHGHAFTDGVLRSLSFENLQELKISGMLFTGSALTPQNTRKLKVLHLWGSSFTYEILRHLSFESLQELKIGGNYAFTGSGLTKENTKNLKKLTLAGPNFTQAAEQLAREINERG